MRLELKIEDAKVCLSEDELRNLTYQAVYDYLGNKGLLTLIRRIIKEEIRKIRK